MHRHAPLWRCGCHGSFQHAKLRCTCRVRQQSAFDSEHCGDAERSIHRALYLKACRLERAEADCRERFKAHTEEHRDGDMYTALEQIVRLSQLQTSVCRGVTEWKERTCTAQLGTVDFVAPLRARDLALRVVRPAAADTSLHARQCLIARTLRAWPSHGRKVLRTPAAGAARGCRPANSKRGRAPRCAWHFFEAC